MSNNELASIISGFGNRLAKRVGGSSKAGGTNMWDTKVAEINAQAALRGMAIQHILGQDAAEREHARSNEAAQQAHEHTTQLATQAHEQQMEKLRWVAENSVHGGDVHFESAAGDVMKFKANNPPTPTQASAPKPNKPGLATKIMPDGSHLPVRHRSAYVNGTRAEKIALNKKHFYKN